MILKDFFTMVQKYQGKSDSQIESDWLILTTGPGTGDWQYYRDCWVVDGELPWDGVVQQRVNARYMKGWSTKDPFAYDHDVNYSTVTQAKAQAKPRPTRRILNA